jgi:tetratricopeptide (TPR) repeat protein
MNHLATKISAILRKNLEHANLEISEITPINHSLDPKVRAKNIERVLSTSNHDDPRQVHEFILQVKHRQPSPTKENPSIKSDPKSSDKLLQSEDGKFNILYLMQNAELLTREKEYSLARNIYQAIIKSGELPSEALFRMGCCFEAEGQLESAISNYEEAIAFSPNYKYHERLVASLITLGQESRAAETIERALHLKNLTSSQKFDLLKSGGNCWARTHHPKEAEISFKRALDIEPNADEVRSNLGVILLQQGKSEEAKRHFQDSIASNPRNYQAQGGLGSCALQEGDTASAHGYFAKSLYMELNNPHALFYLINCAYSLKRYDTALSILSEYIQISPVNACLLYTLASLFFHSGRRSEALETANKTLELQENHAGAIELIGIINKCAVS